jgi:hypothetical protein
MARLSARYSDPVLRKLLGEQSVLLTITSLLSIVFLTFHLTGDIIRGFDKGGIIDLAFLPIAAVWLYGTLGLAERRSGYVIILLGSILALAIPVLHMGIGRGLSGPMSRSGEGAFFFIWTIIALGVIAPFSIILSARGLWSLRPANADSPNPAIRKDKH